MVRDENNTVWDRLFACHKTAVPKSAKSQYIPLYSGLGQFKGVEVSESD